MDKQKDAFFKVWSKKRHIDNVINIYKDIIPSGRIQQRDKEQFVETIMELANELFEIYNAEFHEYYKVLCGLQTGKPIYEIIFANSENFNNVFMFKPYNDKSFTLTISNGSFKYFPLKECEITKLDNSNIEIQMPHWLYKKNEIFLKQ